MHLIRPVTRPVIALGPIVMVVMVVMVVAFTAPIAAGEENAAEKGTEQADEQPLTVEELDRRILAVDAEETETRAEVAERRKELAEWERKLSEIRRQVETAGEQIDALAEKLAAFEQSRAVMRKRIEATLRAAGEWVSFREQVAPIFQRHCVACHNPRNPQGRYNMANHAAILSPGESGPAIEPGDAELSLLFQLIEDGSMPYDADPLPEADVETIRRWIDSGARIDAGADAQAMLVRLMPRQTQPEPPESYRASVPVTALAVSPDGQTLATSGYHEVLLWSLKDGQLRRRIGDVAQRVHGLDFHPDGRLLAVAAGTPGRWGEVSLFDVESGRRAADVATAEDSFFAVAFAPDGRRLATACADGSVSILSLREQAPDAEQAEDAGQSLGESEEADEPDSEGQAQTEGRRDAVPEHLIEDHSDWVVAIDWSPDGSRLVTASRDQTAKVFDSHSGQLQVTFSGHGQAVTAVAFAADGARVASSGEDGKVRLWNAADAKQLHEVGGFAGNVRQLVAVGERHWVAAGEDQVIRWHQAADAKVIREFDTGSRWNASLAVAPDGETLVVGNQDGEIVTIDDSGDPPDPAAVRRWVAKP